MSVATLIPGHDELTRPSFTVTVSGQDVTAKYGIISFVVSRHANKIAVAKVMLHDGSSADQDFELSSGSLFKPGTKVTIKAGYAQKEKEIFEGIIVKHGIKAPLHGNSVISIELRHEAVKLTVIRKNKYFTKTTESGIMKEVLGGLAGKIQTQNAEAEKEAVQYYSTDWDFVLSRAEANGLLAVCTDKGKVDLIDPLLPAAGVPLNLVYGDNIVDFEAEVDARDQYGAVEAKAWSPAKQDLIKGKGSANVTTPGNFTGSELSGALELSNYELQHPGNLEESELRAWASNILMRSRLSLVRGRVRIYGTNAVKPGNQVKLGGVGERFNGLAFVSGVVHGYDVNGTWTTDIFFGLDKEPFCQKYENITDRAAAGLLPGVSGLHVGVVTKIAEDPGNEFRIKVRIPVISTSEEGVWARMGYFDAGPDRGMLFRPEVNDEVVLGFINDDPRDPVILGMLYSSKTNKVPADLKATDTKNNIKGWVTKSKIKVLFDDEKKIVTIETPGKNSIVIDDDKKSITLKDQNKNKLVLDDKGITLESGKDIILKAAQGDVKIDGMNIKQKAQTQFKAEGSSGAEVSSSASLTLKGGVVKIN